MEGRITRKVENYLTGFKQDVKTWFDQHETDMAGSEGKSEFLQFVFDYNSLSLSKDDFSNVNGQRMLFQISYVVVLDEPTESNVPVAARKMRNFAGHILREFHMEKIQPNLSDNKPMTKKRDIWVQDIQGIQYFIDAEQNVYLHEDIISNKSNPSIIANYQKVGDTYSIPDFDD